MWVENKFIKIVLLAGSVAIAMVATSAVSEKHDSIATQAEVEANITMVKAYFNAIQTGDLDTVGASLSPDVVLCQPGQNRFSGTNTGKQAVFGLIGGMLEVSQGCFEIDKVHAVLGNGSTISAIVGFLRQGDGASMLVNGADILTVKDGQIVEAWLCSDNQAAKDAF